MRQEALQPWEEKGESKKGGTVEGVRRAESEEREEEGEADLAERRHTHSHTLPSTAHRRSECRALAHSGNGLPRRAERCWGVLGSGEGA